MLGNDPNSKAGVRELSFKEHQFQVGDTIFTTDKYSQGTGTTTNYLARIESIPTGMISSADQNKVQKYEPIKLKYPMKGCCTARHLDELLGYVDFNILGELDPETKQIVPI